MKIIEDICQRIVAPLKLRYSPFDLGTFPFNSGPVLTSSGKRNDFTVTNSNGLKIQSSFYENPRGAHQNTCIIYLHSMNGSRL